MPDYRTLIVDGMTGDVKAEIPFTFSGPFTRLMNGTGSCSGSFPADHPKATHDIIEDGLRELTVLRDDVPVWNGPIIQWAVDSITRLVQIQALEASAYFNLRVIEQLITHNEDRFDWVRDVWTYITTKTSTAGDGTGSPGTVINAAIPNFAVSAGLSGYTLNSALAADGFYTFKDVLDKLASDPAQGIEWYIDYTTGSTRQTCQRTLKLGAPLGSTLTRTMNEANLYSYGRTGNLDTAATRVHLRGNGIVSTWQNTGSLSSWPLMEQVYDRGDLTDQTELDNAAKEKRRAFQPPVKVRAPAFTPNLMLPWQFYNLGDTIPMQVNDIAELLNINVSNLRVVGDSVTVPDGTNQEVVALTMNPPLSATGA